MAAGDTAGLPRVRERRTRISDEYRPGVSRRPGDPRAGGGSSRPDLFSGFVAVATAAGALANHPWRLSHPREDLVAAGTVRLAGGGHRNDDPRVHPATDRVARGR